MWPFSEPFACGGVAISEPFAYGSVALSMWRCPWTLYIDVAFSLHNYAEVWPFLCIYGGVALSMWRCGDF